MSYKSTHPKQANSVESETFAPLDLSVKASDKLSPKQQEESVTAPFPVNVTPPGGLNLVKKKPQTDNTENIIAEHKELHALLTEEKDQLVDITGTKDTLDVYDFDLYEATEIKNAPQRKGKKENNNVNKKSKKTSKPKVVEPINGPLKTQCNSSKQDTTVRDSELQFSAQTWKDLALIPRTEFELVRPGTKSEKETVHPIVTITSSTFPNTAISDQVATSLLSKQTYTCSTLSYPKNATVAPNFSNLHESSQTKLSSETPRLGSSQAPPNVTVSNSQNNMPNTVLNGQWHDAKDKLQPNGKFEKCDERRKSLPDSSQPDGHASVMNGYVHGWKEMTSTAAGQPVDKEVTKGLAQSLVKKAIRRKLNIKEKGIFNCEPVISILLNYSTIFTCFVLFCFKHVVKNVLYFVLQLKENYSYMYHLTGKAVNKHSM